MEMSQPLPKPEKSKANGHSRRKSKQILIHVTKHYKRRGKNLPLEIRQAFFDTMVALQDALLAKDKETACEKSEALEALYDAHLKRPSLVRAAFWLGGFACVLCLAILIRQMWFELYEIPTGSMRPTLQEQDRLIVSKSALGINIPFIPKHLYFDPDLIKRGDIVVFTTAGLDIPDRNMLYFYVFPGKKQYVKRLIGKPGDTLYFYGGQIYGIDSQGNSINHALQNPKLPHINHVPFIHFEGKPTLPSHPKNGIYSPLTIRQMNEPVAKLTVYSGGHIEGQMLPNPHKPEYIDATVSDYYQLWGMENFAMCRLLTPAQGKSFYPHLKTPAASAYLELTHHPSIKNAHLIQNYKHHTLPGLNLSHTLVPLEPSDLKTLYKSLTTARFIVKNGRAHRYGAPKIAHPSYPQLDVPNGTYQFQEGIAYSVHTGGVLTKLAPSHPLNTYNEKNLFKLFNLGIEFNNYFKPTSPDQILPSRYAYFRDGNLYSMNMPILKKDNPNLIRFIQNEYMRQQNAPSYAPYQPFDDQGPPEMTKEFLMRYGLTIPEGHYLALGDNYPMSADSREFGFVPAGNLRGQTTFIFWPPGARFGFPPKISAPLFSFPNLIIWALAAIGIGIYYRYHRRTHHLPLDFGDRPN